MSEDQDQMDQILNDVIKYLNSITVEDPNLNDVPINIACFYGCKVPQIPLRKYITRLINMLNKWEDSDEKGLEWKETIGVKSVYIGLYYILRSGIKLTAKSVHRYIMIATFLAFKYIDDYYISNKFWSEVAGCSIKEVNLMEIEFCKILKWDFSVVTDTNFFEQICNNPEKTLYDPVESLIDVKSFIKIEVCELA
jgi:hypothetical protein